MRRRLERVQRAGKVDDTVRLHESDYLLGVHDTYRSGALRLRLNDAGEFLDNQHGSTAPPFVQLRELQAASLALERDQDNTSAAGDDWLRMLIAPGGSLGGARPKASVVDPQGRHHFASAMTLTDHLDGDDASTCASYLEIARVLIDHGAQTDTDLHELWSRIVFNMLVSNTDDHLRNHGFILMPGKGWRLTDAYDMNPVLESYGLKLNISEADNAMDLDLARSVAPYFRVSKKLADEVITRSQAVVRQWPKIADSL